MVTFSSLYFTLGMGFRVMSSVVLCATGNLCQGQFKSRRIKQPFPAQAIGSIKQNDMAFFFSSSHPAQLCGMVCLSCVQHPQMRWGSLLAPSKLPSITSLNNALIIFSVTKVVSFRRRNSRAIFFPPTHPLTIPLIQDCREDRTDPIYGQEAESGANAEITKHSDSQSHL